MCWLNSIVFSVCFSCWICLVMVGCVSGRCLVIWVIELVCVSSMKVCIFLSMEIFLEVMFYLSKLNLIYFR